MADATAADPAHPGWTYLDEYVLNTTPSAPPAPANLVAALPGDFSVDNKGSGNYSVPLKPPPGRSGMEPKLSLNYSSGGGNGPLGLGFSLSTGFPQSITRGRSILARDGVVRGVNFDTNDKFYLDGKRLICVGGTYGTPGSTYRTEVDSFVTITTNPTGSNIDTFTVTDKSGTKMTFGKYGGTTDGYQVGVFNGADDPLAYAYALKRVEDALGNSVDLSYLLASPHNGEYVLSQIAYTANTTIVPNIAASNVVALTYSTTRPDKTFSYIAGRRFTHEKRLDSITVTTGGTPCAIYTSSYQQSFDSNRTQLYALQGQFWDATTSSWSVAPPTAFTWSRYDQTINPGTIGANGMFTGSTTSSYGFPTTALGDFTGTGKEYYLTGINTSPALPAPFSIGNNAGIIAADLNGDGRKDLLVVMNGTTATPGGNTPLTVCALISNGDGTFSTRNVITLSSPAPTGPYLFDKAPTSSNDLTYFRQHIGAGILSRFSPGDYYGDGCEEVLVHAYDGYRYLLKWDRAAGQLVLTTPMNAGAPGNGPIVNTSILTWVTGGSWPDLMRVVTTVQWPMDLSATPCDMNGDGVTDYLWQEKTMSIGTAPAYGNGVTRWWMTSLSVPVAGGGVPSASPGNPGSFMGGAVSSAGVPTNTSDTVGNYTKIVLQGDFNGDGITDFLQRTSAGWQLRINKGTIVGNQLATEDSTALPATFTANGETLYTVSRFMPKVTWDGTFQDSGPNQGRSLTDQDAAALGRIQIDSSTNTLVLDVNHDGLPDLVWFVEYKKLNADPDAQDGAASSTNKGWWVAYNTGTAFAAPQKLTGGVWSDPTVLAAYGFNSVSHTSQSVSIAQPDLNGDGLPDWVISNGVTSSPGQGGGPVAYAYSIGTFGDLVTGITTGTGRKTEVLYKAAKDPSIYTPGAAVTYPIRELLASTPVVSDVYQDVGAFFGNFGDPLLDLSGNRVRHVDRFSYQYSGNRIDMSGRGALGFHSFITLDRQTNLFKYQFLVQSFPMTGLTNREETYRWWNTGGRDYFRFISSHDNTVVFDKVSTGGGATLWPFISSATESRWEDSTSSHFDFTAAMANSQPESLFPKTKPGGPHITITAQSTFDGQTLPKLTLPEVSGYNPSDTNAAHQNSVVGTTTADPTVANTTFSGLPGLITYGNLKKLYTDYDPINNLAQNTETVDTTYYDISYNGRPSLVNTVKTTTVSPAGGTEIAPVKSYTAYEGNTPLVKTEVTDAGQASPNPNSNLNLTTTYTRDSLGRVINTQITSPDPAIGTYSVSSVTGFDAKWDAPATSKNAEPYYHPTNILYHAILGQPTSVTDVNGAQVTTGYDAIGRVVLKTDVLKNLTTGTAFAWTTSSASDWTRTQTVAGPAGFNGVASGAPITDVKGLTLSSLYAVHTTATVAPSATAYYDRLGRVIRTVKDGFGTQQTVTDSAYNNLGQTIATSLPYAAGGTPLWTTTTYDALGRVSTVTAPNGTITANSYKGRITQVSVDAPSLGGIDPAAQVNSTLVDAKGRTVDVWNDDNRPSLTMILGSDVAATSSTPASIAFALDGFGRMRSTTLLGQSQTITAMYDALGHQTQLADPDKGTWNYTNNALGQVVTQTDAKGNLTTSTFDHLGRPLNRTAAGNEVADFYYYDTSATVAAYPALHLVAHAIGSATDKGWIGAPEREDCSATGSYATTNLHYYDDKGRPCLELARTDGKWFYTYTDYVEPGGLDYSRVHQVRHYWKPSGAEAPGTQPYLWQDFGYVYTYDSKSYLLGLTDSLGRSWWDTPTYDYMDRVTSVTKGASLVTNRTYRPEDGVLTAITTGSIQNLGFNFDGLGNLTQRTDALATGGTENLTYDNLNRLQTSKQGTTTYQPNGNIASKPDVAGNPVTITPTIPRGRTPSGNTPSTTSRPRLPTTPTAISHPHRRRLHLVHEVVRLRQAPLDGQDHRQHHRRFRVPLQRRPIPRDAVGVRRHGRFRPHPL